MLSGREMRSCKLGPNGLRESPRSETAPARPLLNGKLVERRQLVERLGTPGVDLAPLTVLSAPAGYGKTELLRQWTESLPADFPLLHLSAANLEEPLALWKQVADFSYKLQGSPKVSGSVEAARERGLQWVEELAEPVVVVVDDYEQITNPDLDDRLLRVFMSSEHIYLVMSGRRFASFDTPLVTSQVDSRVLFARDLAFTPEEVAALPGYSELSAAGEALERIAAIGGWPLATAAILQGACEGAEDLGAALFLERIDAASLTEEASRVFATIAAVGGTSALVLLEATGLPPAQLQQCLAELSSRGLVERRWVRGGGIYVPHRGLKHTLTWFQEVFLDDEDVARIWLLHARDLAEHDPTDALVLLLENGEFGEAEILAIRFFSRITSAPGPIVQLLAQSPQDALAGFPTLLALLMLLQLNDASVPIDRVRSIASRVTDAVYAANGAKMSDADAVHLTYLVAAERILGHWDKASALAEQLELRLSQHRHRTYWGTASELPLMYAVASLTGILSGDYELAERTSSRSLRIATDEAVPAAQVASLERLALLHAMQVNPEEAASYLSRADAIRVSVEVSTAEVDRINGTIARAMVTLFGGKTQEAAQLLGSIEYLLPRMEQWALFAVIESWVIRTSQGSRPALERLRWRLQERSDPRLPGYAEGLLAATMANLAMHDSNLRAAQAVLEVPLEQTRDVILAKGRLAFHQGQPLEAIRITEQLLEAGSTGLHAQSAMLLGAAAFFTAGDQGTALSLLHGVDLRAGRGQVQMILPTIPFGVLRELAEAAHHKGDSRLLELIEAVPARYRSRTVEPLSARERAIVQAVGKASTINKAAAELSLSPNTVKAHLRQIYPKLDVTSKADMLSVARGLGIV